MIKEKLKAGEIVHGTMLTECLSPEMAPLMAAAGLDFFIIDTEHSPAGMDQIEAMSRVARQAGIAPLVRVTQNEYYLIARALDCGAAGVVAPRIQSAEEAREVVAAVKYPPEGRRGFGVRGILAGYKKMSPAEAMAHVNRESIVVVQVESAEAIEELPKTVQVPGIDAIMIGPNDLSISLGLAGEFDHPKFKAALDRIVQVCAASPVAAGVHLGDLRRLSECKRKGYRFLIYSSDMALILQSLRDSLRQLQGEATASEAGMY